MKTGIELIAQERAEQIEKHGRTVDVDKGSNYSGQLVQAAELLLQKEGESGLDLFLMRVPNDWSFELFSYMMSKPYKDRLVIAGALIAAEIDRIS